MTRLILSLAILLVANAARGQVDFSAQCTPKQRTDALRASFATAKPGDTINVPAGIYADANFPAFPQGVRVVGAGRGRTVFQSPDILAVQDQNCFELRDGSVVESLTMQSIGPKDQQICVCGFNGDQIGPRSAVVKDCEILGGCWGVYTWTNTSPKLRIENCLIGMPCDWDRDIFQTDCSTPCAVAIATFKDNFVKAFDIVRDLEDDDDDDEPSEPTPSPVGSNAKDTP